MAVLTAYYFLIFQLGWQTDVIKKNSLIQLSDQMLHSLKTNIYFTCKLI